MDNENTLSDNLNPRAKKKTLPEQINEKVLNNKNIDKLYQKYLNGNRHAKSELKDLIVFREVKQFIISMSSANSSSIRKIAEQAAS